jgi:hypothetical protein
MKKLKFISPSTLQAYPNLSIQAPKLKPAITPGAHSHNPKLINLIAKMVFTKFINLTYDHA